MIKVEGLSKIYGDHIAVDDISFEVKEGEIIAFIGPNGAGKSTTIKMLTGILERDAGDIHLRHQGSIEIEGEIGSIGKIGGASLLVVGERAANDVKLLIFEIFVKRLTQEILHSVSNDSRLVHTLNESHGGHTLTETRDGSFLTVFFQLFGNLLGIVVFSDLNLDAQVQIS